MQSLLRLAQVVDAIAFIGYGATCLASPGMRTEFQRYGLPRFRVLTGVLEVAGGLGIFCGLFYNPLLIFSTAGLAVLMAAGAGVRFRIRDPLAAAAPALVLMVLNLILLAASIRRP